MLVSAASFAIAPKHTVAEIDETLHKWSTPAELFLVALHSFACLIGLRTDDENTKLYFEGNRGLVDTYLRSLKGGETEGPNYKFSNEFGRKEISVKLSNGEWLSVKDDQAAPSALPMGEKSNPDYRPTITFTYKGKEYCSSGVGIYTTVDAWLLTQLSKINKDPDFRESLGIINEARSYEPRAVNIENANYAGVDFYVLAPGGLHLSGIKLKNPNFVGSRIIDQECFNAASAQPTFKGAEIEVGDFRFSTLQTDLRTTKMNDAKFNSAYLYGCTFPNNTDFSSKNFEDAKLPTAAQNQRPTPIGQGATSVGTIQTKPLQRSLAPSEQPALTTLKSSTPIAKEAESKVAPKEKTVAKNAGDEPTTSTRKDNWLSEGSEFQQHLRKLIMLQKGGASESQLEAEARDYQKRKNQTKIRPSNTILNH